MVHILENDNILSQNPSDNTHNTGGNNNNSLDNNGNAVDRINQKRHAQNAGGFGSEINSEYINELTQDQDNGNIPDVVDRNTVDYINEPT